mmetsp:Transcript_18089/g.43294  ORF Transcript_18089/g.43294 Transcript_18089/m.43294 type:complete len:712 (+) Transcript_18089:1182-3317(+)
MGLGGLLRRLVEAAPQLDGGGCGVLPGQSLREAVRVEHRRHVEVDRGMRRGRLCPSLCSRALFPCRPRRAPSAAASSVRARIRRLLSASRGPLGLRFPVPLGRILRVSRRGRRPLRKGRGLQKRAAASRRLDELLPGGPEGPLVLALPHCCDAAGDGVRVVLEGRLAGRGLRLRLLPRTLLRAASACFLRYVRCRLWRRVTPRARPRPLPLPVGLVLLWLRPAVLPHRLVARLVSSRLAGGRGTPTLHAAGDFSGGGRASLVVQKPAASHVCARARASAWGRLPAALVGTRIYTVVPIRGLSTGDALHGPLSGRLLLLRGHAVPARSVCALCDRCHGGLTPRVGRQGGGGALPGAVGSGRRPLTPRTCRWGSRGRGSRGARARVRWAVAGVRNSPARRLSAFVLCPLGCARPRADWQDPHSLAERRRQGNKRLLEEGELLRPHAAFFLQFQDGRFLPLHPLAQVREALEEALLCKVGDGLRGQRLLFLRLPRAAVACSGSRLESLRHPLLLGPERLQLRAPGRCDPLLPGQVLDLAPQLLQLLPQLSVLLTKPFHSALGLRRSPRGAAVALRLGCGHQLLHPRLDALPRDRGRAGGSTLSRLLCLAEPRAEAADLCLQRGDLRLKLAPQLLQRLLGLLAHPRLLFGLFLGHRLLFLELVQDLLRACLQDAVLLLELPVLLQQGGVVQGSLPREDQAVLQLCPLVLAPLQFL